VLEAVKQDRPVLEYAAAELQSDRDAALVATKQNGPALEYAATELHSVRECVLEAAKQTGLRSSTLPRSSSRTARLCSRP